MRLLELNLPSPEANLALDEALLDEAEQAGAPLETLRLWEPRHTIVVLGRSSRLADEVHWDACRADGVTVARRASGGAAIVTGPGCLMYALVLSYELRPELRSIDAAHCRVLSTVAAALDPLCPGVQILGTSDLAIDRRKFSGNSVRCKQRHMLYHGTLLYGFPIDRIGRYLRMPPRQPGYREDRPHERFVMNLPLPRAAIRQALVNAWGTLTPHGATSGEWLNDRTMKLVAERYGQTAWVETR